MAEVDLCVGQTYMACVYLHLPLPPSLPDRYVSLPPAKAPRRTLRCHICRMVLYSFYLYTIMYEYLMVAFNFIPNTLHSIGYQRWYHYYYHMIILRMLLMPLLLTECHLQDPIYLQIIACTNRDFNKTSQFTRDTSSYYYSTAFYRYLVISSK